MQITATGPSGGQQLDNEPLQMTALRRLLFPPGPNAYSRLSVHDFSDSVNALPPEEMNQVRCFCCGQSVWSDPN